MNRRLVPAALFAFVTTASSPLYAQSTRESAFSRLREVGVYAAARMLSTEYSVESERMGFGGGVFAATHLRPFAAVEAALMTAYGRQEGSYYRPPLWTFTPTLSLLLQMPRASMQPYAVVGAGYEFVRYTYARCDCEQSRSLGIGHIGGGIRAMVGANRAFRAQVTGQIGKGGPAVSGQAGMSMFFGVDRDTDTRPRMQPPGRVIGDPALPPPSPPAPQPQTGATTQPSAQRPVTPPPARTSGTQPPTSQTPATQTPPRTLPQQTPAPAPRPGQTGAPPAAVTPPRAVPPPGSIAAQPAGTVLLIIDGTQVDFTKPTWVDEVEPILDGLLLDLTSDAGESVRISIEGHTDNTGSNTANMTTGLNRARAVRDYLLGQGVAAERMQISSAGEETPVAANTTALGRQQNRRIVIRKEN